LIPRLATKVIKLVVSIFELAKLMFTLKPIVKNQEILLVGSSPVFDYAGYRPEMKVVNINGSSYRNQALGIRRVDVTFLDCEVLDPMVNTRKASRSELFSKGILTKSNLGALVQTQSNDSVGGDPGEYGLSFENHLFVSRFTRRLILFCIFHNFRVEANRNSLLSTGGLALATIACLKPKTITLTGFSFFKAHASENPPKAYDFIDDSKKLKLNDTRSHSLADSLLISFLSLKNGNVYTDDLDLLPLINNWGTRNGIK
jgi:hypothetical protein